MLSPMCQYWAEDGMPNDWHFVHLGARAVGGAAIVMTESVHVEAEGRITKHCLGLWSDAQRNAFARIAAFITEQGAVPGIQLGHAGRKASLTRPWEGMKPLSAADGGWQLIGPSPLPFAAGFPAPIPMDTARIASVTAQFAAAARRARVAGFKLIEIHAAHGYLQHQFLSPLSNQRTDRYGGSLGNRARFLMEVIDAVRVEWPDDLPLFVRLSCTDWVPGGWDMPEAIVLSRMIKATGKVDLIDCSSGGNDPRQTIPIHPGYQVPFAETIRREAGIATGAVGLLHSADVAEEVIGNGRADLVVLGRTLLGDPHWPLKAANDLKARSVAWPLPYERSNIF